MDQIVLVPNEQSLIEAKEKYPKAKIVLLEDNSREDLLEARRNYICKGNSCIIYKTSGNFIAPKSSSLVGIHAGLVPKYGRAYFN